MKISVSDNDAISIDDTFPIADSVSRFSDEPDPLHRICYAAKKELLRETGHGVAYIINRQIDENGNANTTISFVYSNSIGKIDKGRRTWIRDTDDVAEAAHWKGEMALRCAVAAWSYMTYEGLTSEDLVIA